MGYLTETKKIIEIFLNFGKIVSKRKEVKSFLTNKGLLKTFKDLFSNGLEGESLGTRMLYPMSFHVLMHPDDYKEKKQAFPFIIPEIVKAFYNIIEEQKQEYPDYEPVSKKWVFQFTPCYASKFIDAGGGDVATIEKGTVIPTAVLYNQDIDSNGTVSVDQNIMVSVKCDNSNVIKTANINLKALAGVDILDEGFFTCKFDMNLPTSTKDIEVEPSGKKPPVPSNNQGYATLSYDFNGQKVSYTMKDSHIYISGKNDLRSSLPIFRMEYPDLENGHVEIKHEADKFFLCAFGKTRLNEKNIELSKEESLKWVPLANNSSILMNDTIQVDFKIL